MRSSKKTVRCKKSPPAWHNAFMAMVPTIAAHAKYAFRRLDAEAREEAVQEVVCNACCVYSRLVELKRTDLAYASVLAKFGVAQVRAGRKVGGNLNNRDVSSEYCRRQKGLILERLDKFDTAEEAWQEVLVESKYAGPAETAAIRLDFSLWLRLLPRRLRKIATFLAQGEATKAAANRFGVSDARISQIRKELYRAWHGFQGDMPALSTT